MSFKIKRINARKITLAYLYACFLNENLINNFEKIKLEEESNEQKKVVFFDLEGKQLTKDELELLKQLYEKLEQKNKNIEINIKLIKQDLISFESNVEENVNYVINNFFSNIEKEMIDYDYIFSITKKAPSLVGDLENNINKYLTTFKFNEMDFIDRAIFLLGYTEWKVNLAPTKVIQNEMVELAKRYGDEWSDKLINAIFYKLFW